MSNDLKTKIFEVMERYDYPISAQFIASKGNFTKKEVNGLLYAMEKNGEVKQFEMSPPLWGKTTNEED